MLGLKASLLVASLGSLWLGFFIDRGFRQGTTYNMIGFASKKGINSGRVEKAIQKHFTKWNWLFLAVGLCCASVGYIIYLREGGLALVSALCIAGTVLIVMNFVNLGRQSSRAYHDIQGGRAPAVNVVADLDLPAP